MRSLIVSIISLAACAGANEKPGAKGTESSVASSDSSAGNAKSEPPRAKISPAPASLSLGQFWPTKICTRGPGAIIVKNSCVCDSKMTCSVTRRGNVLDLHVTMTQEACKDCGTFAATCNVPTNVQNAKALRITIDGKPALDALELPPANAPLTERCWD